LQISLCPPPGLIPKMMECSKEIQRRWQRKRRKKNDPSPRTPYSSPAEAMNEGVGRNNGSSPSSASCRRSSSLSLRSHSDASLPASSLAGSTMVERKSSTAWMHLMSARKSRIVNRLSPLPVRTSAHRIFCRASTRGRTWIGGLPRLRPAWPPTALGDGSALRPA